MGCISSKLFSSSTDLDLDCGFLLPDHGATSKPPNHVVSLTSSTYGVLNLDPCEPKAEEEEEGEEEEEKRVGEPRLATKLWKRCPPPPLVIPTPNSKKKFASEEPPEIINVRELMEDLDAGTPFWTPLKRMDKYTTPKQRPCTPGSVPSSRRHRRRLFGGKENSSPRPGSARPALVDSNRVLKPFSSSENAKKWVGSIPRIHQRSTSVDAKAQKSRDNPGISSSRRSLSPFFDPELVDSFERDLCREGEQIKKMVGPLPTSRKSRDSESLLKSFEAKCPRGGEKAVILYTTTLRGIRKTFENCNRVRTIIESHDAQIVERDISMDSGFREELRELMGKKEVKVPVVFVKGRLVGGADEVLRLEEEGKLMLLLEGIPKAAAWCEGCGGLRFVMCHECSGSCKVLDEDQKKMVRCGKCNENGLIHCSICC